jgi:DNA-binding XRE family transcriptional regulator
MPKIKLSVDDLAMYAACRSYPEPFFTFAWLKGRVKFAAHPSQLTRLEKAGLIVRDGDPSRAGKKIYYRLATIGDVVRRLRDELQLSQAALAERANLPKRTIESLEQRERLDPQISTAIAIADALGISVDELCIRA